MFIIYKDTLYDLLEEKTHFIIITRNELKSNENFLKTKRSFYKNISLNDINIQDIFNIQFFLKWDSHFEKVDTVWEIFTDKSYLKDGQVLMRFANGQLPGWRAEEQTVCSRYVDINECEDFTIVYTYTVKDGERLETPLK